MDLNIGTGKSLSAVELLLYEHLVNKKKVFSNIKLIDIEYTPFKPENIEEVLETKNSVVLFDELSAILHKNHRIDANCKKHSIIGLCYLLVMFFRQVRKNDIATISTGQVFTDAQFQLRQLMHNIVVCEKYHIEKNRYVKCNLDKCPEWHGEHIISQTDYRTGIETKKYLDIYHKFYDSNEIVKGWV